MLYTEFTIKAKEELITQADNGLWFLEPEWKYMMSLIKLEPEQVSDYSPTWDEIKDMLNLEVQKRNTIDSVKPYVLNWIHDVIATTVEPSILEEETDYIKNLTEYLKAKKDTQTLKDKEDWDKFKST